MSDIEGDLAAQTGEPCPAVLFIPSGTIASQKMQAGGFWGYHYDPAAVVPWVFRN